MPRSTSKVSRHSRRSQSRLIPDEHSLPARDSSFPIVGIGASAGGLDAITRLLKALPPEPGMAFVIVQHLDPTHESALTALLSRVTPMPVREARNNLRIEKNHVYVIPPNRVMVIRSGKLKLTPRRRNQAHHMPIDWFLQSLAAEQSTGSIGVILSGSGSDGTQGLLAIKAAGGITFVQDKRTAQYPAMPAAATAAGCVDAALSPVRIAQELVRMAKNSYVTALPAPETEGEANSASKHYQHIFALLRQRVGVDFTHYKQATLQRRIQRRMVLRKIDSLKNYVVYIRRHPSEVQQMFNDLLIHVTGFFRDRQVFTTLKKKIFPRLIKGRPADQEIRIWVPGCSTGEEVYSIAIALLEYLADKHTRYSAQIFGTDINLPALDKARAGIYPSAIVEDVSADRLRRFFSRTQGGYRIAKSIRDICLFARQNVVADPPFSNLDLISCRNLLIYLGPALQKKVFPVFHYALRPDGALLLGAAETIGSFSDLFSLTDKKSRLYTKKPGLTRPTVTFHPSGLEMLPPIPLAGITTPAPVAGALELQKETTRVLLSEYCPAAVVINRHFEVLQFQGRTSPFLEHPQGEASLNLLKLVREGLVADLRAAVSRTVKQKKITRIESVHFRSNHHFQSINLEISPLHVRHGSEPCYLVVFQPVSQPAGEQPAKGGKKRGGRSQLEDVQIQQMREEVSSSREALQTIVEEQDATNEELRSANEEIMSSNEELQSTNEELETAREELQSTNEELITLNDELASRATELERANNDLHNLLASASIAIVMIGPDLNIRRSTSIADKMLGLIPADVGRPITDIKLRINIPDLDRVVADVIDNLHTRELEVRDKQNRCWLARIRPYKTTDNRIDGAVIALVEVNPSSQLSS